MRVDKSSNSRYRLASNSHVLSATLLLEPAQIVLESRREFSLVWPKLEEPTLNNCHPRSAQSLDATIPQAKKDIRAYKC